jgi:hypothetical protein
MMGLCPLRTRSLGGAEDDAGLHGEPPSELFAERALNGVVDGGAGHVEHVGNVRYASPGLHDVGDQLVAGVHETLYVGLADLEFLCGPEQFSLFLASESTRGHVAERCHVPSLANIFCSGNLTKRERAVYLPRQESEAQLHRYTA